MILLTAIHKRLCFFEPTWCNMAEITSHIHGFMVPMDLHQPTQQVNADTYNNTKASISLIGLAMQWVELLVHLGLVDSTSFVFCNAMQFYQTKNDLCG
jgi:hypothetical protein